MSHGTQWNEPALKARSSGLAWLQCFLRPISSAGRRNLQELHADVATSPVTMPKALGSFIRTFLSRSIWNPRDQN